MKIKKLIFILITALLSFKAVSQEVEFEASKMDVKENGNLIFALNSTTIIPLEKIKIRSDKVIYNKKSDIITFTDNVIFNDELNNIDINSNKIIYKKKENLIYSEDKTLIIIENKYTINSKNVFYDRNDKKIYSNKEAVVEDNENNIYKLIEKFVLNVDKEIIKSNKAIIIDNEKNKYFFDDLFINIKENELAGKEIKVEFEKSYFGNSNNEPVLKGRSGHSNNEHLKVYKGVFSTCNIQNKKCRGWELSSKEFNHDKEKKIFEYKDSWLKLFGYKAFFLPYFNHPDPSVKRKSGFLTPSYSSSTTFGTAINFPYFKVLGQDRDLTLSPRYYADKSFLLQNEYRQVLINSNIMSDFSFLVGNDGTKSHFFYNQFGKFSENVQYELNLQDVEGDNYLKNHKLSESSSLIDDDGLLLSNLDINWNFENSYLNTSFKIFEDLSQSYNDRYQYIFPDFSFAKNIDIPKSYNGAFNFSSYGYNKYFETNKIEAVITNDFLFSSNDFINLAGISTNYNLLLKNSNDYTDNSSEVGDDTNYNLFSAIKIDSSFPLQKIMSKNTHYVNPRVSFRYSPNGNTDLSSKDIKLNYDKAFTMNRIDTSSEIEGGEALTVGLEFNRVKNEGANIFDFRIANIIKANEDHKLPSKSKLNKTRSDIFGNFNYRVNKNLKLGYEYSYDRDLEYSNLDQINIDFNVNNFVTNFNYFTENHDFGDNESIINKTSYNFDSENRLSFETTKNLKDDFTEYYDLIYTYMTDCLSINLNYNKSFYRDGNLEPNKSLSFLLKIIPFTELGVPNVGSLVGK